jgi:hypothetical protein
VASRSYAHRGYGLDLRPMASKMIWRRIAERVVFCSRARLSISSIACFGNLITVVGVSPVAGRPGRFFALDFFMGFS